MILFDCFGVKFDQIREFRTSKFEFDWSNSNFWPEFDPISKSNSSSNSDFFQIFLSRIRNSSKLTVQYVNLWFGFCFVHIVFIARF